MAARRSRWEDSRRGHDPRGEGSESPEPPEPPRSTRDRSPEQRQTSSEGERSSGDDESEESDGGPSSSGDEREASPAEGSGRRECPGSGKGVKAPKNETAGVSQAADQGTAGGPGVNLFANDGSFLELFKRKMEAAQNPQTSPGAPVAATAPPEEQEKKRPSALSFVGKRRGGTKLALKTGIVAKKQKTDEDEISSSKGGAWAQYMAEVKKYKAHQCSDDDKTRPLVK